MVKLRCKRSPFLEKMDNEEDPEYKVEVSYFLTPKGRCPVEDDFLNTRKVPRDKKAILAARVRRYAIHGEIRNNELCHRLKGRVRDFWVFKHKGYRLFFFKESEAHIIITHGFFKKEDDLRSEEEDRMLNIRNIYNNKNLYK